MSDPVVPALKPTASDHLVSGLQALTSAADIVAPGFGSFIGMLVGQVIPGQRNERLTEYVSRLSRRMRVLEGQLETDLETLADLEEGYRALASALSPEQRALFEDGAEAAVRATSPDRIATIANVVAEGLAADEIRASEQRRFLQMLRELSEEDVVVLCSYTNRYGRDGEWRSRHEEVLEPVPTHMQSSQDELDKEVLRELRTARLVRLDVLAEKTNRSWGTSVELTPLGRYVLRHLGLLGTEEV